jgi:hypothetical protein
VTVETATFISELDSTLPLSTNFVSEGDNHVRLLKSALQATFPNASRAFRFPSSHTTYVAGDVTVSAVTDDNKAYVMNATAAQRTVNLPNAPADGFTVWVFKGDSSTNGVVIDAAGSTLINEKTVFVLANQWEGVVLIYASTLAKWLALYSPPGVPNATSTTISDIQALLFAAKATGAGFARKKSDFSWTQDQGYASIIQQVGDGENVFDTGIRFDHLVPFDCQIVDWTVTGAGAALAVATCEFEVFKNAYADYTSAISGTNLAHSSTRPKLTAAHKNTDATLTSWVTTISAADIVTIACTANTDAVKASINIRVKRAL